MFKKKPCDHAELLKVKDGQIEFWMKRCVDNASRYNDAEERIKKLQERFHDLASKVIIGEQKL